MRGQALSRRSSYIPFILALLKCDQDSSGPRGLGALGYACTCFCVGGVIFGPRLPRVTRCVMRVRLGHGRGSLAARARAETAALSEPPSVGVPLCRSGFVCSLVSRRRAFGSFWAGFTRQCGRAMSQVAYLGFWRSFALSFLVVCRFSNSAVATHIFRNGLQMSYDYRCSAFVGIRGWFAGGEKVGISNTI